MTGFVIGQSVPWNAGWTSEERYEIRPCRWVGGRLALWSPHSPGEGKPIFARPHAVRQRRSISEMLCTVCGQHTPPDNRWWFKLGNLTDGYFMSTEAPVHRACADHALAVCPHLRGREQDLQPLPGGYRIMAAIVGGPATDRDFGIDVGNKRVIGHLKLAWPESRVRITSPVGAE